MFAVKTEFCGHFLLFFLPSKFEKGYHFNIILHILVSAL